MSEQKPLPSSDEFFGVAGQAPTADEFFGPRPTSGQPAMQDWLFEHGPRASILNAFGHGVAQGWGAEPLQLGDEATDFLRKSGVFNDLNDSHQSWLKTFNEALLRPAVSALATAGESLYRGGAAALRGAQAGVEALGYGAAHPLPGRLPGPLELIPNVEGLARDIAALPEAFPTGELGLAPHPAAPRAVSSEATAAAIRALTPPDLVEARSLGVVGEGEAGWKGLAEPIPQTAEDARAAAIKQLRSGAPESGEVPASLPDVQPVPDVHSVARQIAPQVFQEYDGLAIQRETLLRRIDDLDEMRSRGTSPAIDALDQEILGLRAQQLQAETRQDRAAIADRVTAAEDARTKLVDDLPKTGDTDEMAAIRQQRATMDYRMRDLSPEVSAAYRTAQDQMLPGETPAIAPAEPALPAPAVAEEPAIPAVAAPTPETAPAAAREVPSIHDDVIRQLTAAGRPADEAQAAASLVAAHYEARAARFEGALGTPEQLYAAEAPTVEAGAGTRGPLGKTILNNGDAVIRLMGHADASTFIHETGHAWLEELMRDAVHEQAPADLVRDANTVRDWLGVEEGETIPTKAHEKFARGFERYMMEGRAPNNALAKVFDQFKQWLTQIYQTVSRLRSPITDDIRDVYDRLISLPGHEPVIAEDMAIPGNFAAEHEALAERTTPEMAGGAADRVRAEADRVALEKDKDLHDELAGRSGAAAPEAGRDTPTDRGPDRNGPAAGPEPGEARALEPVGAERAGRGEAAAEQPGLAGGANADANTAYRNAGAESPYIDRAGNIRLDLLGTPADVSQVIRDAATENNEFIDSRRGVISDAEVLRLADALGMDASQLDRRKLGQAFNAEEVTAARKLLVQSANTVRDAMAKAAASADDADLLAMAAAMDRHRMIQGQVSGVTAEAGRALRAFQFKPEGAEAAGQIGALVEEATGRTLNQLRRIAQKGAALGTPAKVSKFTADVEKKGLFDWIQSYFVNALISGPATHGTYTIGNTILALFKATAETGFQAAVGVAREAITGVSDTDRIRFGEIPAQLYGMVKGQRDGWRGAWEAFKTDQTVALPGEKLGPNFAFGKGVIPNPEIAGVKIPIGTVLESPSRMVAALHTLSRTTSERAYRSAQAYRMAASEGLNGNRMAARIRFLEENPTEEMQQAGITYANENALMQRAPYRSFTSAIQRVTNFGVALPDIGPLPLGTLRPLKFIDPFVAISSNIIKSAVLERTPLGLLTSKVRADLSGANGTLAFDQAAGRMLAGTSFYMMAGGLAAEGLITGSAPDDYRKAMVKRMTGWQEHSVKIGDMYYSANRLGVLGMAVGIAADLYNVAHMAGTEDFPTAAWAAVHAFSQNVLDESFMRGPSELLRAITEHERYGASFVRSFLSSFVPFSVGASQIARTIDPYTRQARTITDAMLRKIPWESETLYPFRDIWGEPMPNRESVVPGLTAIYESRVNNDPVNQRLSALGMGPALPERKIRGIELTGQQYDDYARIAGRLAKARLDRIVPAAGFTQQPEAVQREIISKTISAFREAARVKIMMEHDGAIVKQANSNKKALLAPPAPPR